jgi:hypothetical protein
MARAGNRLTALKAAKATKPGLIADGHGLYLRIGQTGAKSWVFRYRRDGRLHDMGLGPLHTVTLADARSKALDLRRQRLDGTDPLTAKREAAAKARVVDAKAMTFQACAEAYIAAHRAGWKNAKHAKQWPNTLRDYVYPVLGELPVQAVDVALVMKAVEPIWTAKPETASRVRGRIESVLDWATARGYRNGENPARWRGHLENLLPKKSRVRRVERHAALPYAELGAFMAELRQQDAVSARAMEFAILTAARTGEVTGAMWQEIDFKSRLWMDGWMDSTRRAHEGRPRAPRAAQWAGAVDIAAAIRGKDRRQGVPDFPRGDVDAVAPDWPRRAHGSRVPVDVQ